jgi:hypothetical protein
MKKILSVACLFFVLSSSGQALEENDLIRVSNYQSPTPAKYRLYPTFNRFNFLRLNTTNGVIDQVQYDTDGKNRSITALNIFPLVENGAIDRFTLYPTLNNWTFILLDQIEGTTYQVQWGFESKNRLILKIDK